MKIVEENKVAHFKYVAQEGEMSAFEEGNALNAKVIGENLFEIPFDFLHLAPALAPPKFVRNLL